MAGQSGSGTYGDEDVDVETICPGQRFTKREQRRITREWQDNFIKLCGDFSRLVNEVERSEDGDEVYYSSLPPAPLNVLPETTELCIEGGTCYHRRFRTNVTYETSRAIGSLDPTEMLQVLSLTLRLSPSESFPISVYGILAVRDNLQPLRNYIFNRTRDDPIVIDKDSFDLTLCSPCRGMYVLAYGLLEVDLWIKNEGDRSADEQLFSAYVEIELRSGFNGKCCGRIYGDRCMLDMGYIFVAKSVTVLVKVSALADNPSHVRFTAFSSSFEDEIILFEGKGIMKGELIDHVVAVKEDEKLGVRLKLGNSVFEWTFLDGVTSSPDDDFIVNQFHVSVFYSPNDLRPTRWGFL